MAGTFIFKPLQAHLTHNKSHIGKMSPYCEVILGKNKIKGQVANGGGQNPQWVDVIIMRGDMEAECQIIIKSSSTFSLDKKLGECTIDLRKVVNDRKSTRWLDIYCKGQKEGELLIDLMYNPDDDSKVDSRRRSEIYVLRERNRIETDESDGLIKRDIGSYVLMKNTV